MGDDEALGSAVPLPAWRGAGVIPRDSPPSRPLGRIVTIGSLRSNYAPCSNSSPSPRTFVVIGTRPLSGVRQGGTGVMGVIETVGVGEGADGGSTLYALEL